MRTAARSAWIDPVDQFKVRTPEALLRAGEIACATHFLPGSSRPPVFAGGGENQMSPRRNALYLSHNSITDRNSVPLCRFTQRQTFCSRQAHAVLA